MLWVFREASGCCGDPLSGGRSTNFGVFVGFGIWGLELRASVLGVSELRPYCRGLEIPSF